MARPKSLSNDVLRLQGHDRFIKNTPDTKPIMKLWNAPGDLGRPGKAFHKSVGGILLRAKVFTDLDRHLWFELCYLYEQMLKIRAIISIEGLVVRSGDKIVRHPITTIQREVFTNFLKLSEKFGLTPLDRNKIDLPVDANPDDPTREFLFGNKRPS